MPIYEYKCTKCGHITEVWQKFSDPALNKCEECDGAVKKIISHNTFHLKGSGWYATDYGSKSTVAKPAKNEEKGKQAQTKSEDKPKKSTDKKSDAS